MSFRVSGGIMRNTVNLGAFADRMSVDLQAAATRAAKDGLTYMRSITPKDTETLAGVEESGVNQYAIWFRVPIAPDNPKYGSGKPYGAAQNYGWHDRGGGFHAGHFFIEQTEQYALGLLIAYTSLALATNTLGRDALLPLTAIIGSAGNILGAANPDALAFDPSSPYG